MNKKQLLIFSFILVFIISIGSTYAFGADTTEPREQPPQRKIERQLPETPVDSSRLK